MASFLIQPDSGGACCGCNVKTNACSPCNLNTTKIKITLSAGPFANNAPGPPDCFTTWDITVFCTVYNFAFNDGVVRTSDDHFSAPLVNGHCTRTGQVPPTITWGTSSIMEIIYGTHADHTYEINPSTWEIAAAGGNYAVCCGVTDFGQSRTGLTGTSNTFSDTFTDGFGDTITSTVVITIGNNLTCP